LVKKKSYKAVARAYTASGKTIKLTWRSSKHKVATVNAKGKIKAKKPGKAVIRASGGGKTAKIKVTVVKKKPAGAKAKVHKVKVKLPKKLKRKAVKYLNVKYSPKTAVAVKVKFQSSKKKVATVDPAGRLVAKKKGKTVITVKAGKKSKKLKLTVH
jgi:alpha-amylase